MGSLFSLFVALVLSLGTVALPSSPAVVVSVPASSASNPLVLVPRTGPPVEKAVTFKNTSRRLSGILTVTLTKAPGVASAPFRVSANGCFLRILAPNQSCVVKVRYTSAVAPEADAAAILKVTGRNTTTAYSYLKVARRQVPPVPAADAYSTPEDTTLNVAAPGVLGNDSDPNGDAFTAVLVTPPAQGSLTLNPNGSFGYVPAANQHGPVTFSYKAKDAHGSSAPVTVSINVTPVNDAPIARDDAYTVAEDSTLSITLPGVLSNDSDVEGSALTAALVSDPASGTVSFNPDGSFGYTPDADFDESDSFTYRVSDGTATSAPATVRITVSGVNDAPTARADAYTVAEDVTLNVAGPGLLGNDDDVDGDSLSAVLTSAPAHGSVVLNANGSFSYDPAENFHGADEFSYEAGDGTVSPAPVLVKLTVTPVNDAPQALTDSYTVAEDANLAVTAPGVLGNDLDVENDALTATLVSGPAHGTLTLNADGSFGYTPVADYHGPDSFSYRAADAGDSSAPVTVALTVTPVNDAPVAVANSYTVVEDQALTSAVPGVLGNDLDVESNALTASLVSGPGHGSLTLNANGSFSYTPVANYHGPDSFSYRAHDGAALSSPATVSITVTSANDAPVAVDDVAAVTEDAVPNTATGNLLSNDSDVDGTVPTVQSPGSTALSYGSLTVTSTGAFTYTLNNANPTVNALGNGQTLKDSFVYTIADGQGGTASAKLTVTISGVSDNSAPQLGNDAVTVTEDTAPNPVSGNLLSNDSDPDGDALELLDVGTFERSYGTLVIAADGAYTYTLDNTNETVNGLNDGEERLDFFNYQVADPSGAFSYATLTITVKGKTDQAPPIARPDFATIQEDAAVNRVSGFLTANDSDPNGDVFTVADSGLKVLTYGTLSVIAGGEYAYVLDNANPTVDALNNGQTLTETYTYTITDSTGRSASSTLTITIFGSSGGAGPGNQPPVLVDDTGSVKEDTAPATISGNVLLNDFDADGDPLVVANPRSGETIYGSFTINAAGDWTYTLDNSVGSVQAMNEGQINVDEIRYTVNDSMGLPATGVIRITITGTAD